MDFIMDESEKILTKHWVSEWEIALPLLPTPLRPTSKMVLDDADENAFRNFLTHCTHAPIIIIQPWFQLLAFRPKYYFQNFLR